MARGLGRFGAPWRGVGAERCPPLLPFPSSPSSPHLLRGPPGLCLWKPPQRSLPAARGAPAAPRLFPSSPRLLLSLGCCSQGSVPLRLRLAGPPPSPGPSPLRALPGLPSHLPFSSPLPTLLPPAFWGKKPVPVRAPTPAFCPVLCSLRPWWVSPGPQDAGGCEGTLEPEGSWSFAPHPFSEANRQRRGAGRGVRLDVFPGHPQVEPDPSGTCC